MTRPDDVPTRVLDWGTIKWLVSPETDPGTGITMCEVVVYPGKGHERHTHPDAEETIYVISGTGTQTVGDSGEFPIAAGDGIYVPRDALHSTYNTGWVPLHILVTYNPAGAEKAIDGDPSVRFLAPGEAPLWVRDRD